MNLSIEDYYADRLDGNVLLAYKGSITTELINNVLDTVESKLQDFHEPSKIKKKVYNVLVESLQNLFHHIDDLPEEYREQFESRFGILVVTKEEKRYRISTGNFIRNDKISYLKEKIEKINASSKEELKELYKYILNHQKLSEKGGGGLGLVDIARKTGNKLQYSFVPFNEEYSFFNLDVFIDEVEKTVK
jgi:hypothetical protein